MLGSRGLVLLALMALSADSLAVGEEACVVAYEADRLTVHVERASLEEVVQEIGRLSGAKIVGDVLRPRDVTQEFDDVPVVSALTRMLGDQNFTLRYGPDGSLRTIELLGEPGALAAVPTAPASAGQPEQAASGSRRGDRAARSTSGMLSTGQVGDSGVAVGANDASRASPEGFASSGEHAGQEGSTDKPAQQSWPAPDEFDRKLRRSFLNLLTQMDAATLNQYFATPDGQKAQALLQDFATNHPAGSSSDKANEILNRIPVPTEPSPKKHR